jgi:hypothetical protein
MYLPFGNFNKSFIHSFVHLTKLEKINIRWIALSTFRTTGLCSSRHIDTCTFNCLLVHFLFSGDLKVIIVKYNYPSKSNTGKSAHPRLKMESSVFSSHFYIFRNLILDHFQLNFKNIKDTKAPHAILHHLLYSFYHAFK